MEEIEIVPPPVVLQRRRIDPLNDADVRGRVQADEELTRIERFVRRLAAQKKPIGGFFGGLAGVLITLAAFYPVQWINAAAAVCAAISGALLAGGSAGVKSDEYEQIKNLLLKERGLM